MHIRTLLAAAALTAAAASADAASLGTVAIDTGTAITVSSGLGYDPLGGLLEFSGPVTATTADLAAFGLDTLLALAQVDAGGAPVVDPLIDDAIVFDGLFGTPLVGQISDIAFGAATSTGTGIEILFETAVNGLGSGFDRYFVASITGFAGADTIAGPTGLPDPFTGAPLLEATTVINPATATVVPLPAGLVLMLSGLGGLALVAGRRSA